MDEHEAQLESESEKVTEETPKGDPSDNLTPDHPRFKEVIAKLHEKDDVIDTLQKQMEELQQRVTTRQEATDDDTLTREEELALERIEKNLRNRGFVKKDDLEADRVGQTLTSLQGKHNGSDGLPKFVPEDVVLYAKRKGFGNNYESAYRDMHFDAFVQVAQRRGQAEPPTSEKPTGGEKKPADTAVSPADIAKMSDQEYEEKREQLLNSIKPR